MITNPSPSQPGAPASKQLRDLLPLWVWIVLVFWALFTYADLRTPDPADVASRKTKTGESRVDSDSLQDLMSVDLGAKTAFAMSLANMGGSAEPDAKSLKEALSKAEDLEQGARDSASAVSAISAARRVIVLRALLGQPPLEAKKKSGAPLDAFDKALPAGIPAGDRASIVSEGKLWAAAFGPITKPRDREKLAVQVRALPNIRWWGMAATAAIYKTAHNPGEAARWNAIARSRALKPLIGAGIIGAVRGGLTLLGLGLLIALIVQYFERRSNPDASSFWKAERPAVSMEARKIGAGELAGVFLVYLLSRDVITVALTGFPGIGHRDALHFTGLTNRFHSQIASMSSQQHIILQVVAEAVVYVLSALPPLVVLMAIARRRGASLADEIGWNVRSAKTNILYGIGGFAIASPLMLATNLAASNILKHIPVLRDVPSPANPVIPQIVTASGWFVPVMLLLLASIAAPFVEEILFRGVLMNAIQIRFGVWPAIVGSGLIFGFAHPVGIGEKITIAVLGMVFAWMAQTRQSLLPSMTAHFINNLTTTLLLLAVMSG